MTRPISAAEAAVVLRALVVAPSDKVSLTLIESVRSLQVVGSCDCGCASVDFATVTDDETPYVISSVTGIATNGESVGILVWAYRDKITELEVFGFGETPGSLPCVESITLVNRDAE